MAKLKDLIKLDDQQDIIKIQGVDIPVRFDMQSFDFIEEAYGSSYPQFEKDMNKMLQGKQVNMSTGATFKLMMAMIYGMVRSGGTECTPAELKQAISIKDVADIFKQVIEIWQGQYFQSADGEKIKQGKK
jgi:hypothetical protein